MKKEITRKNFTKTRDEYILKLCKNKKVLHIGACDAPYTMKKYKEGNLLHEKIEKISKKQWGIDIDKKGIEIMKSLGFNNIKYFDINKLEDLDFKPDIIIFGETIEHIMNLEIALNNLKKAMGDKTLLIVSTPNFLTFSKILSALVGKENQHPDHNVIFSHKTLETLFKKNKFKVIKKKFTFLNTNNKSMFKIIDKIIGKLFPIFSDTLLFIVKK